MSATTTPDLAVMPTEEELRRVIHVVTEDLADAMLKVSYPVKRIANWQGRKAPTLEDIGRLYVFLRTFEEDFREIERYLRDIRESLYDLDFVRSQDNVNPEPPDEDDDA
jgi:hypothetical protein